MAKGANTDNARGFLYEGRFSDKAIPMLKVKVATGQETVLKNGDPVKFVSGEVSTAAPGDVMLGAMNGEPYVDLSDGDYVALIVPALPDVVFRIQDDAASPVLTSVGTLVDISDVTNGGFTVDSSSGGSDVAIVAVAAADDMWMYNEGDEQYRDILVIFQKTMFNGKQPSLGEVKTIAFAVTADASAGLTIPGINPGDQVVGASVVCTAANASGTLVVQDDDGNDITDGIACAVLDAVDYAATIDTTYSTIGAGKAAEVISVGGTAADTRGIVVIQVLVG